MSPPATWKSETVIPRARKIILPRKMKPMETARLVIESEPAFDLTALCLRVAAEPEKDCDQPDRIDRDKKRDEREEKFFEVRSHADRDLGAAVFVKQVMGLESTKRERL